MIYNVLLAILAFILSKFLDSAGCDGFKWQYWASMVCVICMVTVGILAGRSL